MAHLICLKYCRGSYTRKEFAILCVLCALFPEVSVLAMTATASAADIYAIQSLLGFKKCHYCCLSRQEKQHVPKIVSRWSRY